MAARRSSPQWYVGLMTGTVLDGNIDVALMRSDGTTIFEFGPYALKPYADHILPLLQRAQNDAINWGFSGLEPKIFQAAEQALTRAQSQAALELIAEAGLSRRDIRAIGFHGQTVLHDPPSPGRKGQTRQLGDGKLMAELTGIDVVYDMRSSDMAHGGQGAPLAPSYHLALLERLGLRQDTVFLNLGGVGNLSWAGGSDVIAFDTGPANAPINDWVSEELGMPMDRDGALAGAGQVDENLLAQIFEDPYFKAPFPKSLDRNAFTAALARGQTTENGAAFLTALAAEAVAAGIRLLPGTPKKIIVSGGGRRNPSLMRELAKRTGIDIENIDAYDLRGDAIEAEAFAFLAARHIENLPTSWPSTTGTSMPIRGGVLAKTNRLR